MDYQPREKAQKKKDKAKKNSHYTSYSSKHSRQYEAILETTKSKSK